MSIDPTVLAIGLSLKGDEAATYAKDRLKATEDAALTAFLHKISATHYSHWRSRPQVEAYKPGPVGWLTATLLPPNGRAKRWRFKAGAGWAAGRKPEGALEVPEV